MEFIQAQSNTVKSRPWVNRSLAVEFGGRKRRFLDMEARRWEAGRGGRGLSFELSKNSVGCQRFGQPSDPAEGALRPCFRKSDGVGETSDTLYQLAKCEPQAKDENRARAKRKESKELRQG